MGYADTYASNVANIFGQRAQSASQAELQKGQAWGNAFGQIGQTLGAVPGQLREQKESEDRRKLLGLQMEGASLANEAALNNIEAWKTDRGRHTQITELMNMAYVDGELNPDLLRSSAASQGLIDLAEPIINTWQTSQKGALEVARLMRADVKDEQAIQAAYMQALAPYAIRLVENDFDPVVMEATFAALRFQRIDTTEFEQLAETDANGFETAVRSLLPKRGVAESFTLSPGQRRTQAVLDQYGRQVIGVDGRAVTETIDGPPKAPVKMSIDDLLSAAYQDQDIDEVNRLVKLKGTVEAAVAEAKKGVDGPGRITPNEEISATMRLRQQYSAETQAARKSQLEFNQMKSALAAFKAGGYAPGSQGVLVTFQKILDPISVVRESEYARSASGLSLLQQLQGKYDQLIKGGAGVPADELQKFVELAEVFSRNQVRSAERVRSSMQSIVEDFGLNPNSIFIDMDSDGGGGPTRIQYDLDGNIIR